MFEKIIKFNVYICVNFITFASSKELIKRKPNNYELSGFPKVKGYIITTIRLSIEVVRQTYSKKGKEGI